LFSGDTNEAIASDAFLAYNGVVGLQEGDTVDGVDINGPFDNLALNDNNEAVFIIDGDDGLTDEETLFYASDAGDLGSSVALLRVGDVIDLGSDGLWTVDDFNATFTNDLALGTDGFVTLELDITSVTGGPSVEAVVTIAVPAPGAGVLLAFGGVMASRRRR